MPDTDSYRTLTPNQAKVLFGIWAAARKFGKSGATREHVSDEIGISTTNLGRILTSIRKISSNEYFEAIRLPDFDVDDDQNRGPRPVFYALKWKTFVTLPITARLFLELRAIRPGKDGRVRYGEFVTDMERILGADLGEIHERLQWGEDHGYVLLSSDGQFLATNKRIECEYSYLALLADHL